MITSFHKSGLLIAAYTILVLYLVKFFFIEIAIRDSALSHFQYALLVLALICIMLSGRILMKSLKVLSDIPISFFVLNILGIGIGFYLSYIIGKISFALLFVLLSAFLYVYGTSLFRTFILNNVLISLLVSLLFLFPVVFDVIPVTNDINRPVVLFLIKVLSCFALLSFLLMIMHEMARNIFFVNPDYNRNIRNTPIVLGKKRTYKIISGLSFAICLLIFSWIQRYIFPYKTTVIVLLIGLMAPLLVISFKSWEVKKAYDRVLILWLIRWCLVITALACILISQIYFKR